MDAYLTADAVRTIEAAVRLSPAGGSRGFLLGHLRGDRIYVESALPSPSAAWPSLEAFYELDEGLGGKIIGFFLIGSAPKARQALLQPFGTGKVLVEPAARGGRKPSFAGAMVDYRDGFVFRKIRIVAERPAGRPEGRRP